MGITGWFNETVVKWRQSEVIIAQQVPPPKIYTWPKKEHPTITNLEVSPLSTAPFSSVKYSVRAGVNLRLSPPIRITKNTVYGIH